MTMLSDVAEDPVVAHVAAEPTDEVRWLVLADYLDDRGDRRGANIRRWWKVRPDLVRAWGQKANRRLDKAAARACFLLGGEWWRLCACLNWRLCSERWPVPYEMITTWPAGWSSSRHKAVLADAVAQVELAAFGLFDLSADAEAGAAAVAAAIAAESARSARSAEWAAAESAEWAARAVEWLASSAAESARTAAESAQWAAAESVRSAAASACAAARLYCLAAELLREV